jgi:UPF0755 protein
MRGGLLKLTGVLLIGAGALGAWFLLDYQRALMQPLNTGEAAIDYEVQPGTSLRQLAHELAARGLLREPRYLVLHARLTGAADHLQAGEYAIEPGMNAAQLLKALVAGKVVQHALTLVEGWNFRELMQAVDDDPNLKHTLEGVAPEAIMERIGAPGVHPEGQFYPDTYHFPRGATDVAFLKRAHELMQQRLATEWKERADGLPYDTPYQALIMASIVEKETAVPEERTQIAGVFVRRLKRGMRLETDPTVIYGLGESFDGNLRRSDLKRRTPYNTYVHKGLPPTPIAMPSGASLHAALHPARGDDLYFVARGDGSHQFSATYEEHRRAVARYQLNGHSRE